MAEPSPAENPIDLPTGEPIPAAPTPAAVYSSSSNEPSPSGAKKPSLSSPSTKALAARVRALLSSTDANIAHLQRCLATPGGIDTTLLFICYTTRLTGALLTALARRALLRRSARDLLVALVSNSSKTALVLTATSSSQKGPATLTATLARLAALLGARLKSLGDLASETRTIARLWALLGMYSWARRLVLQHLDGTSAPSTTASRLATAVSWAQLISCTAFQYLENGAYLSGRGVLGWTPREQGRAYVVGSRWLAVYTGLEIGKLLAGIVASRREASEKGAASAADDEEAVRAAEAVRRSLAINLAWTPLTLHWATEGGFLGDAVVGLGGSIPGVLQMRKLWRETAQ